ncbi:MAG TPA: hypothetical protein VHC22_14305 [Pirellulales bacterium]|nr:hypothetical protein [Pirellulales bacterium]
MDENPYKAPVDEEQSHHFPFDLFDLAILTIVAAAMILLFTSGE